MKTEMSLLNKKLELIQWLTSLNDLTIIDKVIELKKEESKDWWSSPSKAEREAIDRGLVDADSGKLNTHSSARKLYEKWL